MSRDSFTLADRRWNTNPTNMGSCGLAYGEVAEYRRRNKPLRYFLSGVLVCALVWLFVIAAIIS